MRQRKTYRVISDYCGQTALAGYRHTLRGARVLLESILPTSSSARIELETKHEAFGVVTSEWQTIENTITPRKKCCDHPERGICEGEKE